jgi:hypothetical protein
LVLFLVAPRQTELVWNWDTLSASAGKQMQTGAVGEIDLNRTGAVEVSEEEAFHVFARDREQGGRPKTDLDGNQLWRGLTLEIYQDGHWNAILPRGLFGEVMSLNRGEDRRPPPPVPAKNPPSRPPAPRALGPLLGPSGAHLARNKELPSLGPAQFYLTFVVSRQQSAGFFLAQPVHLGPNPVVHPYRSVRRKNYEYRRVLFYEMHGTLIPLPLASRGRFAYVQVVRPPRPGQADRQRAYRAPMFHAIALSQPPLPTLRRWTLALLGDWAGQGRYGLAPQHLEPRGDFPILPAHHEVVARALCRYLATSGQYAYTLNLQRYRRDLDPTLDFLFHLKQGHCERFAGALALMLRSLGIGARVVTGFRGADHLGDGHYVVRQSHAHSWVETLVPSHNRPDRLEWLTLDPTPSAEAEEGMAADLTRFWDRAVLKAMMVWKTFVDLNPQEQQEVLRDIGGWLGANFTGRFWAKPGFWLVAAAGGVVLVRLVRARGKGPKAKAARKGWGDGPYGRLVAILGRRCRLWPRPGETPREFGAAVGRLLGETPDTAALADLPTRVVEVFYRVRFGGQVCPEGERQNLEIRLTQLDRALAGGGGQG